jgi:hypothetical protein
MDLVRNVLLESPLKLMATIIMVEAALATVWWFRPGRVESWVVVGGLVVGAVLLVVQHVVVTDREQIEQILRDLALAVDCEEVDTVLAAMDDRCDVDGMDKRQLAERLRSAFEHSDIDEVKILESDVTVEGDTAKVFIRVHCRVRSPEVPYDYHLSAWDLRFVRRGNRWLISQVKHSRDREGFSAGDLLRIVTE